MEPIKVDFTGKDGKGKGSGKDAYLAPKNSVKNLIISIVGTLVGAFVTYYFMLPPINFKSIDTYIYFGIVALIFIALTFITSGALRKPEYVPYVKRRSLVPIIFIGLLVVVVAVGGIISSSLFRAKSYSKIMFVDDTKTFIDDIEEVDFSSVPVLDTDAATVLANRTLGDLAEIGKVSQFELSTEFTQINYKNNPVKVTTLAYGDIFKWFKNTGTGLPGYVVVNMVTQKAELVTLPEGEYIRYSPNEHFGKYLMRHVRFNYPTYIFDEPRFEIDESGRPFWLCPVLDKTIGLFGGTDVKGVVIVDAITGDMVEYSVEEVRENKELQWIDGIYSDDLLVEQFDYYGKYQNGFINSIIGQSGVKLTTEGTNYIAKDDDVYTYTGVTSASSDQAIIGFVLMNMRTKEANFYSISGAKETSAMSSAQGDVQDYAYQATFPILLNVSGQPTYFMSLKDADNLVKRYAMVNVQNYQVAVTGETIAECTRLYAEKLEQNNIKVEVDFDELENLGGENQSETPELFTVSGKVTDIRTAVIDGNSVYFIELDESGVYYSIKASQQEKVVILNVGDTITVSYKETEGEIISASSIEEVQNAPDEPLTEENTGEQEQTEE